MHILNKVAIVTGSSKGIGKAIAIEFAKEGADIAVTYFKEKEKAEAVCNEIRKLGRRSICVQYELLSRKSAKELAAKTIKEFGRIDILVNNAAIHQEKDFERFTDEDIALEIDSDLKGPMILCQEVIPHMKKFGGRIINITSIGGQWGGQFAIPYASSKGGLITLTKSLAKTYAKYNINANAISPGLIETEMSAKELETEAGKKKVAGIPLGRLGTPEEVAKAAIFLASDNSAYITGQVININGGMYLG